MFIIIIPFLVLFFRKNVYQLLRMLDVQRINHQIFLEVLNMIILVINYYLLKIIHNIEH